MASVPITLLATASSPPAPALSAQLSTNLPSDAESVVADNCQGYLNKNINHFNNTNCLTSPNTQSNMQLIYKLICRLLNARSLCDMLINFQDL